MFASIVKPITIYPKIAAEKFSTSTQRNFKVAVIGGAGGIGQPLSFLLRLHELVTHLALYDISPSTPGVAVDLEHIDMPSKVTSHKGEESLSEAIKDSHIVVIAAGVRRKKLKLTRDDLFMDNANMVLNIARSVAQNSPKAIILIITNPVNSLVPLTYEVLKKAGVQDPRHVLGVNTPNVVRAASFIGRMDGIDPRKITIPVIGGHSINTIIPVLSQCDPPANFTDEAKVKAFIERLQDTSTEVIAGKAGGGSATLSAAYASARLCISVLRGLKGEPNVVECTYVKSDVSEASYFANPVLFGKNGVEKNLGYGKLNNFEKTLLKNALPELLKNIKTGEDFVKNAC